MKRASLLRVLLLGMALVVLGFPSESAFAAGSHGGGGGGFHGGGGGFHGGGGGFHGGGFGGGGYHGGGGGGYHGGGYGAGYHGGGWGGYGGGYGYRGGWGGWGWGFGISLNFGWPGWGWGYGYPAYAPSYSYYPYPYYAYPPNYPYYYSPVGNPGGYANSGASNDGAAYGQTAGEYAAPAPYNHAANGYVSAVPSSQAGGTYQYRPSAPQPNAVTSSSTLKLYNANYVSRAATSGAMRTASYRPPAGAQQLPPMRPEVENVIRAVHAMPPVAAQRAIESGRYSNLSPAEMQLVRQAAGLPPG